MTQDRSSPFTRFAEVAGAVAATTSKLRKRDLLAEYLRSLPRDDLPIAATFFAGRPLPGAQDRLGLGWVQQSQALAAASGADAAALNAAYLRHSDLGDAAAELLADHTPAGKPLTLRDVDRRIPRHERGTRRRGPGRRDGQAARTRDRRRGALHRPDRVARDAHRAARGAAGGGDRGRLRPPAGRRAARPDAGRRAGRGGGAGARRCARDGALCTSAARSGSCWPPRWPTRTR